MLKQIAKRTLNSATGLKVIKEKRRMLKKEKDKRGDESEYDKDGEEILEFHIEDNDGCAA